jgi:decaprenylphospho-beta-D-ribofuranose 2-oxidase
MGLTGVVTHATIQMIPIETSYVRVDTERFNDLDAIMSAMVSGDDAYRYSVAWVDCMTTGPRMGRGVLTRGDHASKSQVEAIREDRRLVAPNASMLTVPFTPPSGLLNRLSIKAFNEAWYRKAPQRRDGEIQSLGTFFHPLDGVAWWNRLHGHRGFLQYQFVVDDAHGDVVRHAIDVLSAASVPSFLAVLKRFGPSDPGPLSFPMKGWTLALDIPIGPARLSKVLDDLDRAVAEAGGRIYLAKDSRLSPELLRTMYPDLGKLEAIRRKIDPDGLLASDLSRRLAL